MRQKVRQIEGEKEIYTDKKLDTERHHYNFFRIITLYLQQGLKN